MLCDAAMALLPFLSNIIDACNLTARAEPDGGFDDVLFPTGILVPNQIIGAVAARQQVGFPVTVQLADALEPDVPRPVLIDENFVENQLIRRGCR